MSTKHFIWYLALVQSAALADCPDAGVGTFQPGQYVFVRPLLKGQWMVFDGEETYLILTREEAQVALKTCRDAQGKALQAPHQEQLTDQFFLAVERHGTSSLRRSQDQEAPLPPVWYCCTVKSALPLRNRINGKHFCAGKPAYCKQVDETTWYLFDGRRNGYSCVLTTEQAKAALDVRHDSQGQRVRAPAATAERFRTSVYGQTGRLTRQGRRFW